MTKYLKNSAGVVFLLVKHFIAVLTKEHHFMFSGGFCQVDSTKNLIFIC